MNGGTDDWYYDVTAAGSDLLWGREQNTTPAGKHYSDWFFLMLAQGDLDSQAKRESYINDYRNPDELVYDTGSEWQDSSGTSSQGAANAAAPAAASPGLFFDGTGDQGYILWIDSANDDLNFEVEDSGSSEFLVNGTAAITNSNWHHVAVVFDQSDDTTCEVYLDGAVDTEGTTGTIGDVGDLSNAVDFRIGSESDDGEPYDGKIDEVRVWDDVRTAAEIQQNMFKQIDASSANLVSYWRFNENTGSTAHDEDDTNNNDGTITNALWQTGFTPDHYNEAEGAYTVDASGSKATNTSGLPGYNSGNLTIDTNFYIGNRDAASSYEANGVIDEYRVYDFSGGDTEEGTKKLAEGGDTADSDEYLFSEDQDYTLDFEPVDADATERGEYWFLGADSMFSGINVDLETNGATEGTLNLVWEYWDGTS